MIGEESLQISTAEVLNSEHVAVNCQNRPISSSSQVSVEDAERLDSRGEHNISCS